MYIEKEYMKVMRETLSGGGSRYFAGSRYFLTPGPKLAHAIQHQIFKEKKKKIRPPAPIPDNGCPGISNFFWSRLMTIFTTPCSNENPAVLTIRFLNSHYPLFHRSWTALKLCTILIKFNRRCWGMVCVYCTKPNLSYEYVPSGEC